MGKPGRVSGPCNVLVGGFGVLWLTVGLCGPRLRLCGLGVVVWDVGLLKILNSKCPVRGVEKEISGTARVGQQASCHANCTVLAARP